MRCMYGISGRETTKYTVIYSVYILLWPILFVCKGNYRKHVCHRALF